jgi:hypothetical protein
MTTIRTDDILRSRFRIGGREPGRWLDCYGVAQVIAERRGMPLPDWWQQLREDWLRGRVNTTGFGPAWRRVDCSLRDLRDGDVLVLWSAHQWVAIVHDGHVWSCSQEAGPYCHPLTRWTRQPQEVWRHD